MKPITIATIFTLLVQTVFAQSTFSRIYTLLQSNCSASGCHGGTNPQVFDVSGTLTDVYNRIVGANCANPAAAAKGYKLVDPGYPYRSFLLKKIAHGISADLQLEQPAEGVPMPKNAPKLADKDIELVRQWILFGAPQNGTVVNVQTIEDFYNGKGLAVIEAPAPPAEGEGFQIHHGPIFLAPGEEREYLLKYELHLPEAVEVTRLEAKMNPQSHHFILYKYFSGSGSNEPEGLQRVDALIDQFNIQTSASIMATWQFDRDHELPAGTAYFWEPNTILNVNLHIKNYSNDSVLQSNGYINVYTQPQGSGAVQMYSDLISYGGFNPFGLYIENNAIDTTFRMVHTLPGKTYYIWILQAHTHSRGKDYDIFLRNQDGTKGEQVYEGFYNADYTFNQGFFDYAHPPVREFSPMLAVDMNNGLIHQATYNNSGPSPVSFGLTTDDEMFITYMHYTTELPTAVSEVREAVLPLSVYPNPVAGRFNVVYSLPEDAMVKLELFHLLGVRAALLKNERQTKGAYMEYFTSHDFKLPPGIYFLRLSAEGREAVQKIILSR
ncbi:MAG TPA: T9SS type A sorting domain-containing protein [Chitinophagales bacterium]|nr:T9SS type A sorting domain-containing protein [Chitinophagales bacterium]